MLLIKTTKLASTTILGLHLTTVEVSKKVNGLRIWFTHCSQEPDKSYWRYVG